MEIQQYFDKNLYKFGLEQIQKLSEKDNGPINNVIANLKEFCFGLQLYDDYDYMIFYIDNKIKLSGYGLYLSIKLDLVTRTNFTIEFCKILNEEYPHADIVETFNTFQDNTRTAFEKIGYFTVGNEFDKITNNKSFIGIASGLKGVLKFPMMEKLSLYRWLFDENQDSIEIDNFKTKKVYLLLDSNNNLIKIGQSYTPDLREKTLQGISPYWDLITTWVAPVAEEKNLHKMFDSKRKRGEWFNLNFPDLKQIKQYMKKYKNACGSKT